MFMPRDTSNLSLEEKVELLMDERAIRDVIYRDQRAKSRGDADLMRTCFFDDAVDHHQPYFEIPFKDIADALDTKAMAELVQYIATQILIDIDGDTARVESFVLVNMICNERSVSGHKIVRNSSLRFLDRFERRKGEWRIAERQLVYEWGAFHEVAPLAASISHYGPGTDASVLVPPPGSADPSLKAVTPAADRTDPSYHF